MAESPPTPPDRTVPADAAGRERILRFQSLADGALFAGRYEIVGPIGSGGSGEVFEAFDRTAQQRVALKILFPGAGLRDLERLRRELRIVRTLQHPGILSVYDIGEAEGLFYIVSEMLRGESLAQRLRARQRLPAEEAEGVLCEILAALGHAHAKGVTHRDVKPANVFLFRDGDGAERVVLLDFGLAREADAPGLTATGKFVGTSEYASPEQIRGDRDVGPPTDLYAVGITTWEMLSGAPPFAGISDLEILSGHMAKPLPVMGPEISDAPVRLRALLVGLLEKDPAKRPANATDALAFLQHSRWWAMTTIFGARLAAEIGRRRWARVAGAALLLAASALLGGLWLAIPVAVEADHGKKRIVWTTRAGPHWQSSPFEGPVASTLLVASRQRFAPYALVSLGWDEWGEGEMPTPFSASSRVVRVDYWGARRTPIFTASDQHRYLASCPYPLQSPLYAAAELFFLPAETTRDADAVVFHFSHVREYPHSILIEGKTPGTHHIYHHAGDVGHTRAIPPSGSRHGLALFSGFNNLLGPRSVVFALTLGSTLGGQSPPFTAAGQIGNSANWYLPLPYDSSNDHVVQVDGEIGSVIIDGRRVFQFDLHSGIPRDASDRAGLSPDAWNARRQEIWKALLLAQASSQQGRHVEAAEGLEAMSRIGSAGVPLDVIAFYWSAIFRLKASEDGDVSQASRALALLERALAMERETPRLILLKAEAEIRLGRKDDAAATLRRYWGTDAAFMYRYEWMLLSWLAGVAMTEDMALAGASVPPDTWVAQIRVAHGVLWGDLESARAVTLAKTDARSDEYFYWSARAWLEGAQPDPKKALKLIAEGRRAVRNGVVVPWDALDRWASSMESSPSGIAVARASLLPSEESALRDWSFRGTESLVFARAGERHRLAVDRSRRP